MQHIIKSKYLTEDIETVLSNIDFDLLFILMDENTEKWCFPKVKDINPIKNSIHIVVPPNDYNKNLNNLSAIWQQLTENMATRKSLLINLGGGMISDLGGFAAATFKRGIRYINIPTTLLAAVDASVGGKTGINFAGYKNEIGSFYSAEYVIVSTDFYNTLPQDSILSGFAEMLKHSLIYSENEWNKILALNLSEINYDITDMVFESVMIKENIVQKDPYEKDIRKALNLGHTVGHAFESMALAKNEQLSHGNAVALGLIAELYLSHIICGFPKEKLLRTIRFIQKYYLPFYFDCNDYDNMFEIIRHDKKNSDNSILFTPLQDIGDIKINQNISKDLIFQALDFYRDFFKF